MAVFGGCGSFAAAFSLLHFGYTYEFHHTKGKPWNSLIKAAAPTFKKTTASAPTSKILWNCNITLQLLYELMDNMKIQTR